MSLYGPLAKLEEERRLRRLKELDMKFQATIQHIGEIEKVNEETYKAKKAVMEAAVTRRPPLKPQPEPQAASHASAIQGRPLPTFGRPPSKPIPRKASPKKKRR